MLGDLRDWLAAFDAPEGARPLAPETAAINRRHLRRCWVDVSYRTDLGPTEALRAIAGLDVAWWQRNGLGELPGTEGRFRLRLAASAPSLPLGLVAVGRVRPAEDGAGAVVEAQLGRSGGDLAVVAVPALAALAAVFTVARLATGGPVPIGWWAMVVLLAGAFVLARVFARDGTTGLGLLHDRVPPSGVQPVPLPVCGPDPGAARGEVGRALSAALAAPTTVVVASPRPPEAVRDAVRGLIRSSGARPVAAPWAGPALKGRATRRRIDVYVPRSGSGEQLSSPRLSGSIVSDGTGSVLHLRQGRSFLASWAMLAIAAAAGLGAAVCCGAAVVQQDMALVGGGVLLALFGVGFFAAVVSTGWRADQIPDPLRSVVDAVDGVVLHDGSASPVEPPPPPPLISPYRR